MRLRLTECRCSGGNYRLMERQPLAHLLPSRRLYRCGDCGASIFAPKSRMDVLYWQVLAQRFRAELRHGTE